MRQIDLCEVCEQIIHLERGRWRHEFGFHWHRAKPKPVVAQVGKTDYLHPAYSKASPLPVPVEEVGDAASNLVSFAAGALSNSRPDPEPEQLPSFSLFAEPRDTSGPSFVDTVMANYINEKRDPPMELEAPEPPPSSSDCGSSSDSSSSCDSSSDCGCGGSDT